LNFFSIKPKYRNGGRANKALLPFPFNQIDPSFWGFRGVYVGIHYALTKNVTQIALLLRIRVQFLLSSMQYLYIPLILTRKDGVTLKFRHPLLRFSREKPNFVLF